jgi:hypothetical protein
VTETISIYKIVAEIKLEEGLKLESDALSDQSTAYSRKFKQILRGLSIDPDMFKKDESEKEGYDIPLEAKDAVKSMLNLYTTKAMKSVRKSEFDGLSYKDIKEIIEYVKILLANKLSGIALLRHLNQLELITQYSLKQAVYEFEEDGIRSLIDETKKMLEKNFELTLNQMDKTILLQFYNQVIVKLHKNWGELINIINDLREMEISVIQDDIDKEVCGSKEFEIHEAVLKEILKLKQEEQEMHIEVLKEFTNIKNGEKLLQELKELSKNGNRTEHFKLVTDEDINYDKEYKRTEELIVEAMKILREEKQQQKRTIPDKFIEGLF